MSLAVVLAVGDTALGLPVTDLTGWIVYPDDVLTANTCGAYVDGSPTDTYPYGFFDNPYDNPDAGPTLPLKTDFYVPDAATWPGDRPVLVLVHGGGFQWGCRSDVNHEAVRARDEFGFLVFAIDYRLSCGYKQVAITETELKRYCGKFTFPAQPDDVKAAIQWIRDNASQKASDHGSSFRKSSGKIAVLGFSAGGNLAFMAATTGTTGGSRPKLAAGWSGPTEMAHLSNGDFVWDSGYSDNPTLLKSASERYIGSTCSTDPCSDPDWAQASPYSQVTSSSSPAPMFIANDTNELIPYQEATDFNMLLGSFGYTKRICTVTTPHLHARDYEDSGTCSNLTNSLTVWEETFLWINNHL